MEIDTTALVSVRDFVARSGDSGQLSELKAYWYLCDWSNVVDFELSEIDEAERPVILCIQASAYQHLGQLEATRSLFRMALDLGMSRREVARYFFSACDFTLGRMHLLLDRERNAEWQYRKSIFVEKKLLELPGIDKVRMAIENAHLGLLEKAIEQVESQMGDLYSIEHRRRAREAYFEILRSEMELISQQQAMAVQRTALTNSRPPESTNTDLRSLALRNVSRHDLELMSTSQLGQDIWVLEQTGYMQGGFFVEFGATDGVLLSNTFLLEKRFDWDGICVEPHPRYFKQLKKNRTCTVDNSCIAAETGEVAEFILANEFSGMSEHSHDLHSGKRDAYRESGHVLQLETISLNDLLVKLGAPRTIDFLSIDTEGSEYAILREFPFDEWDVRFIAIEHNFSETREKIHELLAGYGFARTEAKWDDWYSRG